MTRHYDQHVIIKTLDNPVRILFWNLDDFLFMAVPFFIGIGLGSPLVMVSGLFLKPFYNKAKKKYPKGGLQHRLYWRLPYNTFVKAGVLKRIPPSHVREIIL